MKCSQVMTRRVRSVKTTDDAFYAARLMREHAVGFLPVLDDQGRVVGVITDRDLALKVCGGDRAPVDTLVRDVMSRHVVSCQADEDVARAEGEMSARSVTRVVVIDAKGHAVGVLSRSDIARRLSQDEVETVKPPRRATAR